MNIYKYISEFPIVPGKEIGIGADGQVFDLPNNKAIKYSILFDYNQNIHNIFNKRLNVFKTLDENVFVKIYDYKKVLESTRTFDEQNQTYIVYYYVMDKLSKISDDESKVFHTLLSHEDANIIKDYSTQQIINICNDLSKFLDFNKNKVMDFIFNYKSSKFIHLDLHPRNIMKLNEEFKLIDLDRITKKKENI